MTKINKLHFNGVDYDIGDKDIHDLTEKNAVIGNDEIAIADSEDSYASKKIKFGQFQSGLSYDSEIEAGEDLTEGDIILNTEPCYSGDLVDNSVDFGGANTKVAIKQIANGQTMSSIDLYLKATSGSTATGLTFNVESDNNGEPSGTALSTQDIIDLVKTVQIPVSGNSTSTYTATRSGYEVQCFSRDGMISLNAGKSGNYSVILTNLNNPYQPLASGGTVYTIPAESGYNMSLYIYTPVGNWESVGTGNNKVFAMQGNFSNSGYPIYLLSLEPSNVVNKLSVNTQGVAGVCGIMTDDGLTVYILEIYGSYNAYKAKLKRYTTAGAFDISSLTFQEEKEIGNVGNSPQYPNISQTPGYIHTYIRNNNGNQIATIQINNDGTIGNIVSGFTAINSPVANSRYGFVSYDGVYLSVTNNTNCYVLKNTLTLNTELKKRQITLATPQSIAKGTPYRITLTPTGGSGDRFSLGYIERDTTNYNLSEYDGVNWTDDTTKYPYAYGVGNSAQFYLKASIANQGATTKQAMVVRKDTNAFDKVSFDFFGISKRLSNLVAGNSYYISDTPGKLTTSSGGFKVGDALSDTDLLLTTS